MRNGATRTTKAFIMVLAFSLIAACSPGLAPPGPGLDPDAAAPGFNGDRLMTEDGLELPYRLWQADSQYAAAGAEGLPQESTSQKPKAVILALHGFNDYSNAFEAAAPYWAAQGISTYAYDQRGFGDSPHRGLWGGTDLMTQDLATAVSSLRAIHPDTPLYVLGVSMGGAVVLAAESRGLLSGADGLILSGPAVWARETMPWYQRFALWLGAHTVPGAKVTGQGLGIQASDNIDMLIALGRDPKVIKETRVGAIYGLVNLMDEALSAAPEVERPALIIYGERDEVIPSNPTLRFWEDLPDQSRGALRLALYRTGWHMLLRDLEAERVWKDIAAWIEKPESPLPSGEDEDALIRLRQLYEGVEDKSADTSDAAS